MPEYDIALLITHYISQFVGKVCGYATSSSAYLHTYFRMPEYVFGFDMAYLVLCANYTVFHIWYVKYAGFRPPPSPLTI